MNKTNEWRHSPYATEDQLAHLREQVKAAEAELIEREAELVDLRTEIYAFRLEYDTRLGRKVAELEKVEAEIERCRQRINEYHEWGPKRPTLHSRRHSLRLRRRTVPACLAASRDTTSPTPDQTGECSN